MFELLLRRRGGAGSTGGRKVLCSAPLTAVVLALLAFLVPALGSAQPIAIDDFSTDQAPLTLTFPPAGTTASSSASGGGILGGERDLEISLTGGVIAGNNLSAGVGGSRFSYTQQATITGTARLTWDGGDGSPTVDPFGLGGLDFTVGHTQDGLLIQVVSNTVPIDVAIQVFTDDLDASTITFTLPGGIVSPTPFVIPYAAFTATLGSGADFSSVGAVTLTVGSTTTAPHLVLDLVRTTATLAASETVALLTDVDGDGAVDPGDTLRYTAVVSNPEDSFDVSQTGVAFSQSAPGNTTLVNGSVTTTQGTVDSGNGAGDGSLMVTLGTLADGASATVQFDAVVVDPLPAGVTQIVAQGVATSDTKAAVLTDDPTAGGTEDPTVIPVAPGIGAVLDATEVVALVSDANGNGIAEPGDVLEYTVVVSNSGDQDATAVNLTNAVDPNAALVVGSVTTTQGSATQGNAAGDTSVAVFLGTLPGAGGTATIQFRVTIDDPLAPGVTQIVSQGTVTAKNLPSILTDDPATAPADDPTRIPVQGAPPAPSEIPTLGEWGLLALASALAAAAFARLRRPAAGGAG